MKYLFLFIFLSSNLTFTQKKERQKDSTFNFITPIKKVLDNSNMPKYREEFYVLVANEQVKHGSYKKISGRMYNKGAVLEEGNYEEGKKIGFWKIGYEKLGYSQGLYLNDEKVGVWEYYDYNKKIEHKYDYSKKQVLFKSAWRNKCDCVVIENEKETAIKPDSLPIFIGGETAMYRPLFDLITPTDEVIRQKKTGTVLINVIIDEIGKIEVKGIYKSLEPNFDNAVLEGMKTIPNEFIPAKKANKPVKVRCYFPYTYKTG